MKKADVKKEADFGISRPFELTVSSQFDFTKIIMPNCDENEGSKGLNIPKNISFSLRPPSS